MTNKIDLYSKYNETLQLIRAELDPILQNNEEAWIASLPQHVHDNVPDSMRGHYKKDCNCPACTEALVHTFGYLTETHFCNQLT